MEWNAKPRYVKIDSFRSQIPIRYSKLVNGVPIYVLRSNYKQSLSLCCAHKINDDFAAFWLAQNRLRDTFSHCICAYYTGTQLQRFSLHIRRSASNHFIERTQDGRQVHSSWVSIESVIGQRRHDSFPINEVLFVLRLNEKRCRYGSSWKMAGDIWLGRCTCPMCCDNVQSGVWTFFTSPTVNCSMSRFLRHRCGFIFVKTGPRVRLRTTFIDTLTPRCVKCHQIE